MPPVERQKKKEVLQQKRQTLHLPRRSYHLVMGLICFSLYQWVVDKRGALLLIFSLGGPFAFLDFLRLKMPGLNTAALKVFGSIMRREELLRLTANTYYIFALAILVIVFPKPAALLGILYLAVGDPVAAVVGTRWGRNELLAGKSLEGTAANFLVSAVATFVYTYCILDLEGMKVISISLLGGAISAVSEIVPIPINDNLYFPVLAAAGIVALNHFLVFF